MDPATIGSALIAWGPPGVVIALVLLLWRMDREAGKERESKLSGQVESLGEKLAASQEARVALAERMAPVIEQSAQNDKRLAEVVDRLVTTIGALGELVRVQNELQKQREDRRP